MIPIIMAWKNVINLGYYGEDFFSTKECVSEVKTAQEFILVCETRSGPKGDCNMGSDPTETHKESYHTQYKPN